MSGDTLFGNDEAARLRCIAAINSGRPFCEVDGVSIYPEPKHPGAPVDPCEPPDSLK